MAAYPVMCNIAHTRHLSRKVSLRSNSDPSGVLVNQLSNNNEAKQNNFDNYFYSNRSIKIDNLNLSKNLRHLFWENRSVSFTDHSLLGNKKFLDSGLGSSILTIQSNPELSKSTNIQSDYGSSTPTTFLKKDKFSRSNHF